jgi:preprotein translocase subunit SecB
MRKKLFMKTSLVFLLLFPLVLFFYCGGKRTTRPTKPKYKFTINGLVVKDLSLGKDIAYFTILRDSTTFDSALVKVDSDTLENQGGGIYSKEALHLFDFEDALTIMVSSADDDFSVNFDVIIPGFFRITDITGISGREVHSGESPQILFTASANASGYFISVVPRDNAVGAQGHNNLISWSGVGQYTIPVDAFKDRFDDFTEGTYAIYLVAYNKSFVAYPPHMEFELPDGLPKDNISGADGTIGAGVVAPLDSVEAVK